MRIKYIHISSCWQLSDCARARDLLLCNNITKKISESTNPKKKKTSSSWYYHNVRTSLDVTQGQHLLYQAQEEALTAPHIEPPRWSA